MFHVLAFSGEAGDAPDFVQGLVGSEGGEGVGSYLGNGNGAKRG